MVLSGIWLDLQLKRSPIKDFGDDGNGEAWLLNAGRIRQIQKSPSPRTEAYNVAPLARLNTPSFGCDIFIVHKANYLPKPTNTKKPQSED
ncbi:hypothetical protein BCT94_10225 [Vibrio breoganii]|nr:hypothetical protein BCT94_10225 [Vibrio breoganii]